MDIAMLSAVSGLDSMQQWLNVVGGNLSNDNTPGYKATTASFQEMLSEQLRAATGPTANLGSVNPVEIGTGVSVAALSQNYTEGALDTTGVPSDLAINGDGFFILKDTSGAQTYTRNGSFNLDANGTLVNADGFEVQGWQASNGQLNTTDPTGPITVPIGRLTLAKATDAMSFGGNLDSSSGVFAAGPPPTGGQYSTQATVYDSLGNPHTLTIQYTHVATVAPAADDWSWSATTETGAAAGNGTLAFDTNGQYDSTLRSANPTISFAPTGGGSAITVAVDFSSITQFSTGGAYSVVMNSQDGLAAGVLQSYSVGNDGTITGTFSNGLSSTLGRVALATFSNDQGLSAGNDGLLYETAASGTPQITAPEQNGASSITGGALEQSNVDISTEFTDMIVAQRSFEANSKMVSTMDQVLNDLVHLRG